MRRVVVLGAVCGLLGCARPAAGLEDPLVPVELTPVLEDAGVDGGADAGRDCLHADWSSATTTQAWFRAPLLDVPSTGVELALGSERLSLELYYFGSSANPVMPWSTMLWNTTRATCELCVVLDRGPGGAWLANGGDVHFTAADRADSGVVTGAAPLIRMVAWNFALDAPVDGGACLEVTGVSFDGGW